MYTDKTIYYNVRMINVLIISQQFSSYHKASLASPRFNMNANADSLVPSERKEIQVLTAKNASLFINKLFRKCSFLVIFS